MIIIRFVCWKIFRIAVIKRLIVKNHIILWRLILLNHNFFSPVLVWEPYVYLTMLLLCIAVRDNDYPEPVKNPLKIGFGQWYLVVPCWLVAYLYIFFASFFASLRCFCPSSSVLTRHRCVKFHHLLISHLLFFCKGAESRLFLKESQKKAMHTKEVNSFLFPFPSQIFFFFWRFSNCRFCVT